MLKKDNKKLDDHGDRGAFDEGHDSLLLAGVDSLQETKVAAGSVTVETSVVSA